MIKLPRTKFEPIPEGVHVFKITEVRYDKDFGKIEMDMVTKDGRKHIERFRLLNNDETINEGALNVFSYMAKTAMQDFSLDAIDHKDLEGKYIKCEVKHKVVPSTKEEGGTVTFINLGKKYQADGFEEAEDEEEGSEGVSLDDLLS